MASRAAATQQEAESWRTLMRSAQGGDGRAYAILLRDCVPVIKAAARGRRVPPGRVDDVVQDVLLTLHRVRQTYDPGRPFLPWLGAIIRARSVDVLRRTGRHEARELHAPLAYEAHPDPAHAADEHIGRAARAERLRAEAARLPPGQRQALEQLGLQERSLAEVSAETGRSVVALKVNLHRALAALRVRMTKRDAGA